MRPHPQFCFSCTEGRYREHIVGDYLALLPDGKTLSVPDLPVLICDKCGDEVIPPESSRRIEVARYGSPAPTIVTYSVAIDRIVDQIIDDWHEGKTPHNNLWDALGWTQEQYKAWVEAPLLKKTEARLRKESKI